ncbi:MAG: hypothetical protein FJX11_06640 [Alphaproteobacteria bacterium]|nr:hypothetical protein [Alphaproteobacteria bacterium]
MFALRPDISWPYALRPSPEDELGGAFDYSNLGRMPVQGNLDSPNLPAGGEAAPWPTWITSTPHFAVDVGAFPDIAGPLVPGVASQPTPTPGLHRFQPAPTPGLHLFRPTPGLDSEHSIEPVEAEVANALTPAPFFPVDAGVSPEALGPLVPTAVEQPRPLPGLHLFRPEPPPGLHRLKPAADPGLHLFRPDLALQADPSVEPADAEILSDEASPYSIGWAADGFEADRGAATSSEVSPDRFDLGVTVFQPAASPFYAPVSLPTSPGKRVLEALDEVART